MMRTARTLSFALALAALSACDDGGGGPRITIDLEVPSEDDEGSLLGEIQALRFTLSDGRDFLDSQLHRLEQGLPRELAISDVPAGNQILFHLSGLSGTAEVAYGRTCRLAVEEGGDSFSARLYFSRVGQFRTGAEPLEPVRSAGLMYADDQGRAIVTGGSSRQLVELFDPRVGEFIEHGEAQTRLAGAVAVRADGSAILAGGVDEDNQLVGQVEEILPRSPRPEDRIRRLGPERQSEAERTGLALAALPDRSVLLTGGRDAARAISGAVAVLADGDDQFRPLATLEQPRTGHTTSVGLGGVVYVIGGLSVDETGMTEVATGSIELFRPQDRSVRTLLAALDAPRFGHTATVLNDGRILVVGGKVPRTEPCGSESMPDPESCFDAVEEVELFDPIVGEVSAVELPVPGGIGGGIYDHTATMVAGGRVLIAGGFDSDAGLRGDAWLFDPQVEALIPTRALARARARHTATELCDGTVLLVGGESDGDEPPPSERYGPAATRLP
jgi:hypothetical protein